MNKLYFFLLMLTGFGAYSQVSDLSMCDSNHDETEVFNVGTQTATLIMNQPPGNYSVTYHASLTDAQNNTNPLPLLIEVHGSEMTVYARVENTDTHTFVTDNFHLFVSAVPNPQIPPQGYICDPTDTFVLNTQLPSNSHTFTWYYNGEVIPGAGTSVYVASVAGTYSVSVGWGVNFCVGSATTVLTASAPPSDVSAIVTGQTITVVCNGPGVYEYSIDNGVFQSSPVFQNVPVGNHTIVIRDQNGCGQVLFSTIVLSLDKNNFTGLSCAPNPAHDRVKISNIEPIDKITVSNTLGEIVLMQSGPDTNMTLDLSTKSSGLYILKIESGDQQKILKILKQ